MKCIKSECSVEETIKKSRFIGILTPCQNEFEVVNFLKRLQHLYPDASHITFAYRIKTENGYICRFNDAGEPSGTAGKPIFHHLEGKELMDVVLAVIRYFGGIKLGAGGLARAYGNTAKKVIEAAELLPYIQWVEQGLTLEYKQLQAFEHQLKKLDGAIIGQDFTEHIKLTVRIPIANLEALSESYPGLYPV